MSVQTIATLAGVGVFLLILAIAAVLTWSSYGDGKTWFLSGLPEMFYDMFFAADPRETAKKIGFDTDKLDRAGIILRIEPDYKRLVAEKIAGYVLLAVGVVIAVTMESYVFAVICAIGGLLLILAREAKITSDAEKQVVEFESEMVRFLDLLQTALFIKMPIDTAIQITVENMNGVLAQELRESLAKMRLSNVGWQKALYDLAMLYRVDTFTEFVMNAVNSYEKGVSSFEAVHETAKDIKEINQINIREKTSKVASLVLIPTVVFKLIPALAIIGIPIIVRINTGF